MATETAQKPPPSTAEALGSDAITMGASIPFIGPIFAAFGRLDPDSAEARRFVTLEDWANEGEALPYPAARELIEDLFGADLPGTGQWAIGGRPITDRIAVPALHILAGTDLIAPAATAPSGERVEISSGHVGMIVGSARTQLHEKLRRFLDPACR